MEHCSIITPLIGVHAQCIIPPAENKSKLLCTANVKNKYY